ncbi:cytochrome P450-dit2, partial [Ceratobasidium sp. 423]
MLLSIVCLVSGLLALLVLRRHRKLQLAVPLPGPPSPSYLTGHFKSIFGLHGIEFQGEVLKTYGPTVRLAGIMGEQFIFTVDPSFINAALVKDRSNFDKSKGGC